MQVLASADMKLKIGLITLQGKKSLSAFETYLKLINVLGPSSKEIVWVATNYLGDEERLPSNVTLIKLEPKDTDKESSIKRLFLYFLREMKIMLEVRKLRDIDVFVFYCGYVPLFPVLFTTLILRIEGRSSIVLKSRIGPPADFDNRLIRMVTHGLIEKIAYSLAHKIAVEYESMVARFKLQKYQHKIALGNQYVDTSFFRKTRDLSERSYQLGYFGRLSEEKGILELAKSLPLILKDRQSRALIVGEGELEGQIRKIFTDTNIQGQVELTGWIDREQMPLYLNGVRMVVMPSYGEGVPNLLLEAMACETPVLATPVGGIPGMIRDGDTGFIMEDNSPECIARNVARVLGHPDLEQITRNARALLEKEYTYEVVVERYRDILSS
jgi:glycosyltransferase involved in cell wall biosynthesis